MVSSTAKSAGGQSIDGGAGTTLQIGWGRSTRSGQSGAHWGAAHQRRRLNAAMPVRTRRRDPDLTRAVPTPSAVQKCHVHLAP